LTAGTGAVVVFKWRVFFLAILATENNVLAFLGPFFLVISPSSSIQRLPVVEQRRLIVRADEMNRYDFLKNIPISNFNVRMI
jgi:hypothetical protein